MLGWVLAESSHHSCQLSRFQRDTHDIRPLSRVPPDELLKQRLVPLEHHSCMFFANSANISPWQIKDTVTLTRAGVNFPGIGTSSKGKALVMLASIFKAII